MNYLFNHHAVFKIYALNMFGIPVFEIVYICLLYIKGLKYLGFDLIVLDLTGQYFCASLPELL